MESNRCPRHHIRFIMKGNNLMVYSELEQLHRVLLVGVDEIDRICREHGIDYTLTGGSLIGAIRHKGFIPWDDDIDIAMTRKNYNLFLEVCKKDLDNRFSIQTPDNDSDYPYGFAKLLFTGTRYIQKGHENEKWQKGIFIDIFPMDYIPENTFKRAIQKYVNYMLIKMLETKTTAKIRDIDLLKKNVFLVLKVVSKPFTIFYLTSKLQKNMRRYENTPARHLCNLGGFYKYDRETTEAINFDKYIYTQFENRSYKIIERYDSYLKGVYNDYMTLPPESKRHTHEMVSLNFGTFFSS